MIIHILLSTRAHEPSSHWLSGDHSAHRLIPLKIPMVGVKHRHGLHDGFVCSRTTR